MKKSINSKKIIVFLMVFIFFIFFFLFLKKFFILKTEAIENDYLPGEMLVKLKNSEKIYKVKFRDQPDLRVIQKILLKEKEIEYAEPNYIVRAAYSLNDPYLVEQWPITKLQVPQAWDITAGGSSNIVVAILDSGVDINHPDLKDNIFINSQEIFGDGIDNDNNGYIDDYYGWDFVRQSPDPRPKFDEPYKPEAIHHGTVVAGIISAVGNNGIGVAGVAWRSKIMALRVLNSEGLGSVESVIQAINYAVAKGVHVINLSFVGSNRSEFLSQALKRAWQAGIFIVAAAGNETAGAGKDLDLYPVYPACSDVGDSENYVFTVAAVNQEDKKAFFSNYGKSCVDLSAPGTRIFGLLTYQPDQPDFKEYYGGYWSGTSLAAPFVSATVALIKSVNPLLTNSKIRDILKSQSDNIDELNPEYTNKLGAGRLNVYRAVSYAYSLSLVSPYLSHILTGAGSGGGPHVRIFKANGQPFGGFFAYDRKFSGGLKVAAGDTDGDGAMEIITVPGPGGGPHVRVFDSKGKVKSQFFVYDKRYKGGLSVASCDLDRNGTAEIIIGLGSNAPPYVYVFSPYGDLFFKFLAYHPSFKGGVNVSCGDVDGDGFPEIVTGAGPGGGPHVRIFDNQGILKFHFFAFLKKFRGGINVAVGDLNGDNKAEIIVGIYSNASPYVRIFDMFGNLKAQFLAYEKDYYGGVNLFVSDLNDDTWAEIIIGPRKNHEPLVRVVDSEGNLLYQFFAYDVRFKGGVSLATFRE